MLTIKEFAKYAHTTVRTIKYYEEIGLLHPKRNESNYRVYDEQDMEVVHAIYQLKMFGFSLDEIKKIIADNSLQSRKKMYSLQKEYIEKQLVKLQSQQKLFNERIQLLTLYEEHPDFHDVVTIDSQFQYHEDEEWDNWRYEEIGVHTVYQYYKDSKQLRYYIEDEKGDKHIQQEFIGYFIKIPDNVPLENLPYECLVIPFYNDIRFCLEFKGEQ